MVDSLKNNFLLLPAAVLAAILYFLFPAKNLRPSQSLFKSQQISLVECRLASCPVKVGSKKKSYIVKADLISVGLKDGGRSSAAGQAQILLPLELC